MVKFRQSFLINARVVKTFVQGSQFLPTPYIQAPIVGPCQLTGLSVIVCHYPPSCSKWNPIEQRLFRHVHKAMEGVVFSDYETVQKLIEQTSTKTRLTVVVRLNLKDYQKGVKIDKAQMDTKRIAYHPVIPEFNYRIYP